MIPKILHYVWLGSATMSPKVVACMDSWRRVMPDYELRCWDENAIDNLDFPFIKEALGLHKWAFASDVIRLYALYKHGGIYLDTDVMVYRRFDDLLNHSAFCGRESSIHIIGYRTMHFLTSCCIGAEKGNEFIGRCLDYYKGRRFVTSEDISLPVSLRLDLRLNSEILCVLAEEIGYNPSVLSNHIQHCADLLTVFPNEYFDPNGLTPNSHCAHLALGSWRDNYKSKEFECTFVYKLQWRLWAIIDKILMRYRRKTIKLN